MSDCVVRGGPWLHLNPGQAGERRQPLGTRGGNWDGDKMGVYICQIILFILYVMHRSTNKSLFARNKGKSTVLIFKTSAMRKKKQD